MDVRILLALLCVGLVGSVPLRLFYPYGDSRGDSSLPPSDDISSPEIQLDTPIHFFDGVYGSVFVNSNGHLSFESELPNYQPTLVLPLGLNVKLIAAFFADVDTYANGTVYYRETNEEALLQRFAADVRGHFSQFPDFEPQGMFIATWHDVAPYKGDDSSLGNTFQIVIASDDMNSFAIFNYLDDGIQWIQSGGKLPHIREDPPAQAGFDSGSGRLHTKLPFSGTANAMDLARESNINLPGTWMYHIGNTLGGNIAGPDVDTGDVEIFKPEVLNPTCLEGSRTCHQEARCVDFSTGYCCECLTPTYGNGLQCINPANPQRLNGKVYGTLNGVNLDNLDMHTFVVTKDGRAYTAISRVPQEVSAPMMTLNTIGGITGWIFAVPNAPKSFNGYMFTGGSFNRTAKITYQQGGEVIITQRFFGHDALNNIRLETYINGTAPQFEDAVKLTVDDYNEEYTRVSPGVIRSSSARTYRVNQISARYNWEQTMMFDECQYDPSTDKSKTMRLSVTRNFVMYDKDRVVRFAMSNSVSAFVGQDPCVAGATTCHEKANCIPSGGTFSCECITGYIGDGITCDDLNECDIGLSTCDGNATCINVPGSFQCRCNRGFRGDGRTCIHFYDDEIESSGEDVGYCGAEVCHENARCVFNNVEQRAMCECKSGFAGDGVNCSPVEFDCNEVDICHENAECLYSPVEDRYTCECVEGFSGDGLSCEQEDLVRCSDCDPNAECVLDPNTFRYSCVCNAGYTGSGTECSRIRVVPSICERCHPNADCGFDQSAQEHVCRCSYGYYGDGFECQEDCRTGTVCDVNARCGQDSAGNYVCRCKLGYRGDGRTCQADGCNIENNCGENAECVSDPRDPDRYMCRCNPGYTGDGQVCTPRVVPCNEVDNCSEFGECVYDPRTEDHRCRCHRGYEGNGISCRPRGVDCRRIPSLCDPNAACILNVDEFVCVCNQNFRGDGTTCSPISDEMNYLLFSRGYSIHKVKYTQNGLDADGSRVLYVPDELAIGVASDCDDQKFYWTDVFDGKISRASLDGFDKEVVAGGFSSPEGIAFDWLSRNIYVTDSGLDIVAVVSINGTYRKTLISGDLENPRAIALDPRRGVMYWTDWYRSNPTIEQANMDGSDRKVFVDSDLGLPNGITIDYNTQQICWGDAGVNRIECIRSDGVGRRVITEDAPYPFDVSFYGNTIYWSDWTIDGVPSIDRDGGDGGEPLKLPVGGNGRLYGLAAVGEYCPRVTNACQRFNGGCRYICLPTPNGGRTCACPDDIDEITCSEIGTVRKKK